MSTFAELLEQGRQELAAERQAYAARQEAAAERNEALREAVRIALNDAVAEYLPDGAIGEMTYPHLGEVNTNYTTVDQSVEIRAAGLAPVRINFAVALCTPTGPVAHLALGAFAVTTSYIVSGVDEDLDEGYIAEYRFDRNRDGSNYTIRQLHLALANAEEIAREYAEIEKAMRADAAARRAFVAQCQADKAARRAAITLDIANRSATLPARLAALMREIVELDKAVQNA